MPVEILATLLFKPEEQDTPNFDLPFIHQLVNQFERYGYDRVLVPQSTFWPDSMPMATWITDNTKRLAVMVAHRPGFVAPTMAARMFAVLDHVSNGRAGVHIITGGNDAELACDGDFLTKDERYKRSREYAKILRMIWGAEQPVSHAGEYYRFTNSISQLRPVSATGIPMYWGGTSEAAQRYAGECADIYSMGIASLDETAALIGKVRSYAQEFGRTIAFQSGARMIVGDTEKDAWDRARKIAEDIENQPIERLVRKGGGRADTALSTKIAIEKAVKSEAVQGDEIIDRNLWTGTRRASHGRISPCFVGTPEQIVETLLKYHKLGITSFFVRGFGDALEDIATLGTKVIPLLKQATA